jgi:hypothetical protein
MIQKLWANWPQGLRIAEGKQPGIGFRWDAIRFSHKVYAVCHTGLNL